MAAPGSVDLNHLWVFAAIAEAGGFTAAAERLGVAKAKVSLELGRLEAQLGVSLFTRTTRRVGLTEAGQALYADCIPLLRGMEDSLARLSGAEQTELTGTLRISATVEQAGQSLAPAAAEFAARHPRLQIELRSSDRVADLVKEGIDLAIRAGWLRDSTLRAVKLGEFEQWVVAAPDYLQRHGLPRKPAELAQHHWVALTLLSSPLTWKFTARNGRASAVRMSARLRADSGTTLRSLLQHGAGISVLDQPTAEDDIRNGRLQRVLADWSLPRGGIYAVYPPGRYVPAQVRGFIDFYRDFLGRAALPAQACK